MSVHKKLRPVLHVRAAKVATLPAARGAAASRAERIAVAAYFLAEKRSFSRGSELEDWLTAEREIDAEASAARDDTARK
ncbi:MAG: DUF2934 domain-containing protein [Steroidobacteraceae bacterium]